MEDLQVEDLNDPIAVSYTHLDVYKRQDKDGSPAAERGYYLIQPPKIMGKDDNYYGQIRITTAVSYTHLSGDNYPHRIPVYNDAERLHTFRESALKGMVKEGTFTAERLSLIHI